MDEEPVGSQTPLAELPVDVLRVIFERTAASGPSFKFNRSVLSLVSSEVQSWTDPFLFMNISGNRYSLDKAKELSASRRFKRGLQYVLSFWVRLDEPICASFLLAFSLFPNLRSLQLNAKSDSSLANLSAGSLQRVGGSIVCKVDPTRDFQFLWPVFRTITHLDLFHASRWMWPHLFQTGISSLISLQYLRLNAGQPRSFPALQNELEPLITLLPKSVLVILIRFWYDMSPWDKDNLWRFQNCDDGVDSRVLLVNHTYGDREEHLPKARFPWILNSLQFDDRKHWSLETNEDETFWGMALSLVKARQQALSLRS